ncbi:MAG: Holliday junction resolvase RuvX [Dehalococcoidia bacterium]
MGRVLALDMGERRIGLAVSDPDGRLAIPLRILERTNNDGADMRAIAEIARAEGVDTLLVGNPLSMTGQEGPQSQRVRSFGHRLAQTASLPLVLWDERLSSAEARRFAPASRRGQKRRGGRREPIDDVAAALVLQSYLDRLGAGRTPPSTS